MKIKICGITRIEDAQFACSLGIDALGFVFYNNSKRYIEPQEATKIIQKIPPFITTVGLFVNAPTDTINKISATCKLDMVQIHGDETLEDSKKIDRPFMKAIRVESQATLAKDLDIWNDSLARGILIDAFHESYYGGTGTLFDWKLIPKESEKPIILAGGLNDTNVVSILENPMIWGIDVSSSIETAPGVKSHEKMASFVNKVQKD